MIIGIDHIAIAVENLDQAIEMYEKLFGLRVMHREVVAGFDVDTATFPVGETSIELVEGKAEGSPIRKFVEARGPAIHHVAFLVEDIEETLAELKAAGATLIDEKPRTGKNNSLVAFVHPKSTQKVLYEIVQPARRS